MMQWRTKLRLIMARLLIKLGNLTHADYTAKELEEAAATLLPETFPIDVPVSKGELTLLSADITMPMDQTLMLVDVFGSVIIGPLGRPIYRAHVIVQLELSPIYDASTFCVKIDTMRVKDIKLVNDEYSIIETSRDLLGLVFPRPLQNLFTGTVKSAVGILTGGGSDLAANYMSLYLSGSKQKILDYHRPQIESLVNEMCKDEEMVYRLEETEFEEHLFRLYGKEVVVEQGKLRFKF